MVNFSFQLTLVEFSRMKYECRNICNILLVQYQIYECVAMYSLWRLRLPSTSGSSSSSLSAGCIHSSSYSQSPHNWRCNRPSFHRSLPPSLSVFSPASLSFPFTRCRHSFFIALTHAAIRRRRTAKKRQQEREREGGERGGRSPTARAERTRSLKVGHFGFSKSWSYMTGNFLSLSSSCPRAPMGAERA